MNPVSNRTQISTSPDSKSTDHTINPVNPVAQPIDAAAVAKLKKLVSSQDEESAGQRDSSDSGATLLKPEATGSDPGVNPMRAVAPVSRLTPMQPMNSKANTSNAQKTPLVSPFEVSSSQNTPVSPQSVSRNANTSTAQKTPLISPVEVSSSQNTPVLPQSVLHQSVLPQSISPNANPPDTKTSSASSSEAATELAKDLAAPKPTDFKHTETATDSTQNQSTPNLVNPANASVQQVVNASNPTVSGTPNAPASTPDHTALINSVADQLLVSEAKQGAGSQVQIRMNQSVLPDTQVTLKHVNGQLTVDFVSGAQSSSDLLANGAETLASRLANMGSVPVVVTVRQAGATDALLASVTAQAQTGSDQGGFARSRGRQWSEQNTDDTSASS